MALPTRHEQLRIAALNALRHGQLEEIDRHLAAALKDGACEPDLVTEEPECKTALLRAVERADLERVSASHQRVARGARALPSPLYVPAMNLPCCLPFLTIFILSLSLSPLRPPPLTVLDPIPPSPSSPRCHGMCSSLGAV